MRMMRMMMMMLMMREEDCLNKSEDVADAVADADADDVKGKVSEGNE